MVGRHLMDLWTWIIVVWIGSAIVGALIAPRKGLLPRDGAIVGGTLGLIGVLYLALQEDR